MKTINEAGSWRMQNAKCKLQIANCGPSPLAPRREDAAAKRLSPRRGVLLLVVLAVLAMFALIAVAFVFLTSQSRRGAESIKNFEQQIDPPEKLLRQAAMQVFRGPTTSTAGIPDPASVMGGHGLLDDIYGNEYLTGNVNGTTTPRISVDGIHGQLLDIPVNGISLVNLSRRIGCVLTITGVPAGSGVAEKALVGESTRIVGVNLTATPPVVQIIAFPNGALPPIGTDFTINGVPFSGTGFGYNSTAHKLDRGIHPTTFALTNTTAEPTAWPLALLPNDRQENPNPPGGANEDYDVPDFQNMILAAQVPLYNDTSDIHRVYPGVETLPSLHRPALVRYWMKNQNPGLTSFLQADWQTFASTNPELARKIVLRPIGGFPGSDHPNFTGGNPNFNPAWNMITAGEGQWDVDNDGDGVPDSIWVDLGFPARQTADGRWYRPLFAILCVDLDGRLNLNAHGSVPQTDTTHYNTLASPAGGVLNGTVTARGQGIGPADVNLGYLLDPTYPADATCTNRLMTAYNGYQGRYGTDGVTGTHLPGSGDLINPDPLNANKWFEYGATNGYGLNYWTFAQVNNAGSYGSPPDVFGVGAVGLDVAGRPVYARMYDSATTTYLAGYGSGIINSPYELNLDRNQTRGVPSSLATIDNPFSPAEFERILRPYDCDATRLPDRLAQLTTPTATAGNPLTSVLYNSRHSLTADSWDLPCPNVGTPSSMTSAERTAIGGRVKHVTDLLRARGVPESEWNELLPPDLLAGLRMNINRPFGNGLDDDGNGVIDDPSEPAASEQVTLLSMGYTFSYDGSNALAANSLQARQLEARFLYVLAMLVVDRDAIKAHLPSTPPPTDADVARFLAQWAVNAVDFKDRDSIMTPFIYDPSPLTNTGWDATTYHLGPPTATDTHVVWGCERPELLLSETLAFHDRRTQDTSDETDHTPTQDGDAQNQGGKVTDTDPDKHDATFDQAYRPQGSLFVELYNPSSAMEPRSGDFYTAPNGALELTKIAQDTSGNKSPVWRLAIAIPPADPNHDPDDPVAANQPDIERAVYFVDKSWATVPTGAKHGQVHFFPTLASGTTITIAPGRYTVIGPGEKAGNNPKLTYIGFLNGQTAGSNNTRHIDLTGGNALVVNKNNNSPADPTTAQVNTPNVLVIDEPRRLSVSEPVGGYSEPNYDPLTGKYPITYDIPFDSIQKRAADGGAIFAQNGTVPGYRIVYLQRLANPLLPYDADSNPYRTIDKIAVDVTAFNGVCDDSADLQAAGGTTHFESRQRGEHNDTYLDPTTGNLSNLWRQEQVEKAAADWSTITPLDLLAPIQTHNFTKNLKHSIGYLNQPFGAPSSMAGCVGDPPQPFPWLTWNNRPYVSPLEMMQVSWLRSSKLLGYFRTAVAGDQPYTDLGQPFSHLMNYFHSTTATEQAANPSEDLHRVFEYLGVPSPFVGTETQANPAMANSAGHNFRPPFNGISTYREPGRVNLNTIYSRWVFEGLKNGIGPSWQNFVSSRRGYQAAVNSAVLGPELTTVNFPTEFGKPFRSFAGAAMVPTLTNDVLKYDREINATLLRERGTTGTPLFQYTQTTNPVDNTDRNPYFRYQGIQRLGNLVTTRSNVYAVWITVGYFEVEALTQAERNALVHVPSGTPWNAQEVQQVYPGGYKLGQELGVDTGEIERHRAFFIFDRSIPVGYQRGQDLNVDKAILIDRFIE